MADEVDDEGPAQIVAKAFIFWQIPNVKELPRVLPVQPP
jgi:hypothetical protein